MSGEIISFTTVEYPDEASMLKAREIFQSEMGQLADKLRPLGMTKFHSSRLFLPEDRLHVRLIFSSGGGGNDEWKKLPSLSPNFIRSGPSSAAQPLVTKF